LYDSSHLQWRQKQPVSQTASDSQWPVTDSDCIDDIRDTEIHDTRTDSDLDGMMAAMLMLQRKTLLSQFYSLLNK